MAEVPPTLPRITGGMAVAAEPTAPRTGDDSLSSAAHSPASRSSNPAETPILQELIAEHSGAMFRLAKSIVRDTALAEDVVQESLMKAWQAHSSFRGESSLRSWVLRITQNTAISMLRKRREEFRDPWSIPEQADVLGQTDRQVSGRAMVNGLWDALAVLDPVSRSIVVLREVEAMPYEEIAAVLDLPLPTVKTRLFRSRRTLATALEEWR